MNINIAKALLLSIKYWWAILILSAILLVASLPILSTFTAFYSLVAAILHFKLKGTSFIGG